MKILGLIFGFFLAIIDSFVFPIIKNINIGVYNWNAMFIPIIAYGLVPIIFYYGLNYSSMTVLNLSWNLTSNVLVTFIGLCILQEKIGAKSYVGLIFAFIAIALFLLDE